MRHQSDVKKGITMNSANVTEMQQFGMIWPQCVARAWQDVQFRELLKSDPAGALRDGFQFNLPVGVELQVVDQGEEVRAMTANTLRMIIPPIPDIDMREIALSSHPGNGNGGSRPPVLFTFSVTAC
jgi:hypothetical protein